jgi:hypothetical protein
MQTNGFNLASQCSGVLTAFSTGPSSTGHTRYYSQAGSPNATSLPDIGIACIGIEYAVSVYLSSQTRVDLLIAA